MAQRQSKKIMISLTEAEARELKAAAGKKRPSTYIREVLLRHLARRRK